MLVPFSVVGSEVELSMFGSASLSKDFGTIKKKEESFFAANQLLYNGL